MSAGPLRVVLGGEFLRGSRGGIGRFTLEICRALENRPELAACAVLLGTDLYPLESIRALHSSAATLEHKPAPTLRRALAALPAFQSVHDWLRRQVLTRAIASLSPDGSPVTYHHPNLVPAPYDGPTVLTIHDFAWRRDPSFHSANFVRWMERRLPQAIARAAALVAVSEFAAQEAVRELGIPRDQITVVREAAAAIFRPQGAEAAAPVLARYGLADGGFVLSVGTLEPRKNLEGLLAAHRALPPRLRLSHPLVVAGASGWGAVQRHAEAAERAGELRLLGYIPDADLAALMARCGAFAYVSLYEGFGLPVVEAMAAGAPVLASTGTGTGETAGDGALLVEPHDVAAITAGLELLLTDTASRERWRAAGLARAATFSWKSTVDQLVSVWQRLV